MEKIALLPGGFKPPHAGHYNMAKWLAANTDANTVVVKIGAKERDGITRDMSLQLWDLYRSTDPDPLSKKLTILPSTSNSPVADVYDFIEQEAPEGSTIYLGMGEKDMEDARFKNIGKFADPKNITFETKLVPPQAGGVSGTEMRGFIKDNNKELFQKYLPDHIDKDKAWDLVSSIQEDFYDPRNKVLDFMKSSEWKAGYRGKKDIPRTKNQIHNRQTSPHAHMSETTLKESTAVVHDQFIPLEVMDTPELQIQGMMGRSKLKGGMIFPYLDLAKREFHMQNCKIPLDIVFIINNEISKIEHSAPPCKEGCPKYSGKADNILELPGGYCKKHNVNIGDSVGINLYETPKLLFKEMMGTMNNQEKAKHAKNLKRLKKDTSKQGDQYMEVPNYLKGTLKRKLNELSDREIKIFATHSDILKQLNTPNFKLKFIELHNELEGERLEALEYFWDEFFSNLEDSCEIEGSFDKKLSESQINEELDLLEEGILDAIKKGAKAVSEFVISSVIPTLTKLINQAAFASNKVVSFILNGLQRIFGVIKRFKEKHPKLFFAIVAFIVFVILMLISGAASAKDPEGMGYTADQLNTMVGLLDDSREVIQSATKIDPEFNIVVPKFDESIIVKTTTYLKDLQDGTLQHDSSIPGGYGEDVRTIASTIQSYYEELKSTANDPNDPNSNAALDALIKGLEVGKNTISSTIGTWKVNETKYGSQYLINQYKENIQKDYGHQQYRNLQTLMSQNKNEEVETWLKSKGYITKKNENFPPYKANQVQQTRYKASDTFTRDIKKAEKMGYKENVFTKGWWKNIINEVILTEGGAAGHMAHPFNLSSVNSGKDLKDIFNKSAESLQSNPGSVKIDGVNSSIRLVDLDGKKQFVMDRGSKKPLDVKGVTKDDLKDRFKKKDGSIHGMIEAGGNVLDMFNEALPSLENNLKKLGAWDDPNILFNMEYVEGKTNVQDYDTNFIAIHGLNRIESKEVRGAKKMLTKRISKEISYDKSALQSMLDNLTPTAKKRGFEVYGSVPTEMKKKPNFSAALSKTYTIKSNDGDKTQSLDAWLNELNDIPEKDFIFIYVNDVKKKVGAVSKQVYTTLLNGGNIDELYKSEEDKQKAMEGFVTYLATEKLGDEILKVLDSPMGTVDNHEGVVIRDKNITTEPFKITGKFILGGMVSDF